MSAESVARMTMFDPTVQTEHLSHCPHYAQALMWDSVERPTENLTLADTSLYLSPLP